MYKKRLAFSAEALSARRVFLRRLHKSLTARPPQEPPQPLFSSPSRGRCLHTSPPAEFFGVFSRKVEIDPLDAALRKFTKVVKDRNLRELESAYDALVEQVSQVRRTRDNVPPALQEGLGLKVLEDVLEVLARLSWQPHHLELFNRIYDDIVNVFGRTSIPRTLRMERVKALCISHNVPAALDAVRTDEGLRKWLYAWNTVLRGFRLEKTPEMMREVIEEMEETDDIPSPDISTYESWIQCLCSVGKYESAREVVERAKAKGVQPRLRTWWFLMDGSVREGADPRIPAECRSEIFRLVEESKGEQDMDKVTWNTLIRLGLAEEGFKGGIKVLEQWRDWRQEAKTDAIPDEWTLSSVVETVSKEHLVTSYTQAMSIIRQLVDLTGVDPDVHTFAILIRNSISAGAPTSDALRLYQEAVDSGITPDAVIVSPLLQKICSSPSPDIFALKRLYADLVTAEPSGGNKGRTLDNPAYNSLLKACVRAKDAEFAIVLLEDMRERAISLDAMGLTQMIITMMEMAKDHVEAFKVYDRARALNPRLLDTRGYNEIIRSYSLLFTTDPDVIELPIPASLSPSTKPSMSTSSRPSISRAVFQEFINDMRKTGNPPDAYTYSILLTYYTHHSPLPDTERLRDVRAIHNLIKLDPGLDPDIGLYNSLMNAYNMTGDYDSVFGVWGNLGLLRGRGIRIDNASVAVFLDACGFSGNVEMAQRAWRSLRDGQGREGGLRLNKNAWDSYVECLSRNGKSDEASEFVFEEMDGMKAGSVEADVTTFRILLSFVWARKGREAWRKMKEDMVEKRPDLAGDVRDLPEPDVHGGTNPFRKLIR